MMARPKLSYSDNIFQLCSAAFSVVSNLKRVGCGDGDGSDSISVIMVNGFAGHSSVYVRWVTFCCVWGFYISLSFAIC